MFWKSFLVPRVPKSHTGAVIFNSLKRYSLKTNPAPDESIDENDVNFHSQLAAQWWDPEKNPLHALNELRIPFIRTCVSNSGIILRTNTNSRTLLEGLKVLDVGCGGGILCEALARLHCDVTGIDASHALIEVAKEHAKRDINVENRVRYENISLATFSLKHPEEFDVVIASEVLEHVSNKEYFLKLCLNCLKEDGSLFITTPNKTAWSRIFLVQFAELLRIVPAGTHDYEKFITPRELTVLLKDINCIAKHIEGIMYWPLSRTFTPSRYHMFMYALHAVKNTDIPEIELPQKDPKFLS